MKRYRGAPFHSSLERLTLAAVSAGVLLAMTPWPSFASTAAPICLQSYCFDPLTDPAEPHNLAGFPLSPRQTTSGCAYVLVQREGPLVPGWIDTLRHAGAAPVEFILPNAVIVRVPAGFSGNLHALADVRWVGKFFPAYRLTPIAVSALVDGVPASYEWADGMYRLQAAFLPGEDPVDYQAEIEHFLPSGIVTRIDSATPPGLPWGELALSAAAADVPATLEILATTGGIERVALVAEPGLLVDDSEWFLQTGIPDVTPPRHYDVTARLFANGITGAGEVAGIVDSGLEYRECYFALGPSAGDTTASEHVDETANPLEVRISSPQNKVIEYYRFGDLSIDGDCSGHGTHVAGLMAGDNWPCLATNDDPFDATDCPPSAFGQGVQHHDPADGIAPGAQIVFQCVFGQPPGPTSTCGPIEAAPSNVSWMDSGLFNERLYTQAYLTQPTAAIGGVRVENGSIAIGLSGLYGDVERGLDKFQWDHRDFLLTWACGNDGPGAQTLSNPAYFKDGIAVGASTQAAWPSTEGPGEDLARYSAHGPATGGRFKPDVVAPSTTGVAGGGLQGPMATVDPNPPLGTCGVESLPTGTSFSAPSVGGLALLVRQYFRQGYYPSGAPCSAGGPSFDPTNALAKAVIINSTRNLRGDYTADIAPNMERADRPTFGQGWGRPVLDDTLFFPGDRVGTSSLERTYMVVLTDTPNGLQDPADMNDDRASIVAELRPAIWNGVAGPNASDLIHEFPISVLRVEPPNGEDLHVTLAWSDPPGPPLPAAPLVNDLDLELVGPDPLDPTRTVVWRPNPGTSSDPGVDSDRTWAGGYTQLMRTAPCPTGAASHCDAQCPTGDFEYQHPQEFDPGAVPEPFCDFTTRDSRNNVENIFLKKEDVVGGEYVVRVIGHSVMGNPQLMNQEAQPDWFTSDGSGSDHIDSDRQGYALVASGLVAVDRGFIHLDKPIYQCGDHAIVTLVDRNVRPDPSLPHQPEVQLTSTMGDVETVNLVGIPPFMATPGVRLVEAGGPSDFLAEDGVLSFLPEDTITASYADDDPSSNIATTCARTAKFSAKIVGIANSDPCADDDGVFELKETTFLDVTILNLAFREWPTAVGRLTTTDPDVRIDSGVAVFSPVPVAGRGTATARFTVHVNANHACPADIAFDLEVDRGDGCRLSLPFTVRLAGCIGSGVRLLPPEVSPDSAPLLRVRKQSPATLELTWEDLSTSGIDFFNIYRGNIATLIAHRTYDHVATGILGGAGWCGNFGPRFDDPDDLVIPGDFYYLVTALDICTGMPVLEGPSGRDSLGAVRPTGGGCP